MATACLVENGGKVLLLEGGYHHRHRLLDMPPAVILGGTSLFGGRGRLLGTILGVLLYGIIINGLVLTGTNPYLQSPIKGLILLEPTRGIDVHAKADIYRIIEDLAGRGVGILILSYEIDEVIMLADRVLTLYQGEAVSEYACPGFDKDRMLADMAGAGQPR